MLQELPEESEREKVALPRDVKAIALRHSKMAPFVFTKTDDWRKKSPYSKAEVYSKERFTCAINLFFPSLFTPAVRARSLARPLTWSPVRPTPPSRLGSRDRHQSLAVCISSAVLHKISFLWLWSLKNRMISQALLSHCFVVQLIWTRHKAS